MALQISVHMGRRPNREAETKHKIFIFWQTRCSAGRLQKLTRSVLIGVYWKISFGRKPRSFENTISDALLMLRLQKIADDAAKKSTIRFNYSMIVFITQNSNVVPLSQVWRFIDIAQIHVYTIRGKVCGPQYGIIFWVLSDQIEFHRTPWKQARKGPNVVRYCLLHWF